MVQLIPGFSVEVVKARSYPKIMFKIPDKKFSTQKTKTNFSQIFLYLPFTSSEVSCQKKTFHPKNIGVPTVAIVYYL